ncbi:hypothetical protein SISSUDRAFT_75454 [Sistotremastrum suecicum HHB10207 ss-3]|uniref:Uncharacterized protein n=1 Tax=Sistotremastrum suecicum HHB10207 ss-3 TaxID=1314776 RepID=A0A166BDX3_9AGAM|nr:hypothetical protein SISSUDRAFT_75454 [Sistotremastrum suecicum HHB10207 ss-3]
MCPIFPPDSLASCPCHLLHCVPLNLRRWTLYFHGGKLIMFTLNCTDQAGGSGYDSRFNLPYISADTILAPRFGGSKSYPVSSCFLGQHRRRIASGIALASFPRRQHAIQLPETSLLLDLSTKKNRIAQSSTATQRGFPADSDHSAIDLITGDPWESSSIKLAHSSS